MTDTEKSVSGARDALRHGTADLHERVDAGFSGLRLDDAGDYRTFLLAQARAFIPCEAALDQAHAERVVRDWPARRRVSLLLDDLYALGAPPPAPAKPPRFVGDAAILGAIYVLEGSRLGGSMLVRAVPPTLPSAFLSAKMPGAWRSLTQLLDERLRSDDQIHAAVTAAREVFALFEGVGTP